MKKILFCFLSILFISTSLWSLETESMIFDNTTKGLARAVQETSQMQAIYAYNIANAGTEGFKPLAIERVNNQIQQVTFEEGEKEFNLEDQMAKMNENRLLHQAYIRLFTTKVAITQKILTLGK
ncbi:hypothetical protein HOC37_01620 [bacterium]|nr:hypothetical protein [bacterium]